MNFARRATIALVTGILAVSGIALTASPAEAKRDTGWLESRVKWPVRQSTTDFYGHN